MNTVLNFVKPDTSMRQSNRRLMLWKFMAWMCVRIMAERRINGMWRWRSSREISKNWARSFEIDTVRVGIKPAPKPLNGGLTAGWRSVDPFDGGPGCVWRLQTDPHALRKLGKCQPRMVELGGSHRVSTSHASCWTLKSVEIMNFRSGTI